MMDDRIDRLMAKLAKAEADSYLYQAQRDALQVQIKTIADESYNAGLEDAIKARALLDVTNHTIFQHPYDVFMTTKRRYAKAKNETIRKLMR